jgi:hypothetical protein
VHEDHVLIVLNAAAGIGALASMRYALGGAPGVPVEWLEATPFEDYRAPGLILGCVYAPVSLAAAWALWRRADRAGELALAAGAVQVGWIAAQVRMIGLRSFLQPAMAVVGAVDLVLAARHARAAPG